MNRMVWCVFKAIALSIIFVFVWDMGFYLYRTFALNQRMEMLMSSLTKVVQENNYLPQKEAETYWTLFNNIAKNMNGDKSKYNADDEKTGSDFQFINGFRWNYTPVTTPTTVPENDNGYTYKTKNLPDIDTSAGNILVRRMEKPACYGDIMAVYVGVNINTPFWTFQPSKDNGRNNAATWSRDLKYSTVTLDYLYYVPCMNYVSVSD